MIGMKYNGTVADPVIHAYEYPDPELGLAIHGPAGAAAKSTDAPLTLAVPKSQLLGEALTAVIAWLIPLLVPSSARTAASAAASLYTWSSFLITNILPTST